MSISKAKPSDKRKTFRRLRAVVFVLLLLALLYTLIGFWVAGPVARRVLCSQLGPLLNRTVQIERIRLNPYALTMRLENMQITDRDGTALLKLVALDADVAALSLFESEWRIPELTVHQPFLHLRLNRDGSFNFSDILDSFSTGNETAAPPDAASDIEFLGKPIRLDRLTVMDGRVELDDHSVAEPFLSAVDPFAIQVVGLSTAPNTEASLELSANSGRGAKLKMTGTVQLSPLAVTGQLHLTELSVGNYAPYYEESVGFEIARGTLELDAGLFFTQSDATISGWVTNAQVRLFDVALREKGKESAPVQLESASIDKLSVDLFAHVVAADSMVLRQARIELERGEDGTVNLQRFAATSPPAEAAGAEEPGIENLIRSLHLGGNPPWVVRCENLTLQEWSLNVTDASVVPPVQLPLRNLTFSLGPVSTAFTNVTSAFALSLDTPTNGLFRIDGQFSVIPLQTTVAFDLQNLQLGTFSSYLSALARLDLQQGELSLSGNGELTFTDQLEPQARFSGALALADLVLNETVLGEKLCSWERVDVTGITAGWNPLRAEIEEIAILSPQAWFTLSETNHNLAITLGDSEPLVEVETEASAPTGPIRPLPPLTIHRFSMTNAHLVFTDRVRDPDVVVTLQSLEGELSGLSTDPSADIRFRLSTLVDGQAPVTIKGDTTPWTTPLTANLETVVEGIDLRSASPYFGQFLGYHLADGNVSMELASRVEGTRLQVSDQIVIRRLSLGEKTDSPDAPNLPIKFAISLLKDRQGNIELSVPIEGDIDDPSFDILSAITGSLGDLIGKIATSPFSVLGSVFGGDPETLKDQTFAPGSSQVDSDNQKKLERVSKGLYARPALNLEIRGSVDPETDREALRRQKLKHQLLSLQELDPQRPSSPDLPSNGDLSSPAYAALLEQAYLLAFPDRTNIVPSTTNLLTGGVTNALVASTPPTADLTPEEPTVTDTRLRARTPRQNRVAYTLARRRDRSIADEASDASAKALVEPEATDSLNRPAEPEWQAPPAAVMEQELLQNIEVTEQDLQDLANQRVQAVRDALVATGEVEVDRILLPASTNTTLTTQGARALLSLR